MKLHTKKGNEFEVEDTDILLNNVIFNFEFNPHKVRLWVIGHEFGPIVALWASCEQDAFDEMLDAGYEQFLVEEPEPDTDYAYLGNASEPCNLDYAWIEEVELLPGRDLKLIVALAEGRGAGHNTLWN